jgi:hypothetical protein
MALHNPRLSTQAEHYHRDLHHELTAYDTIKSMLYVRTISPSVKPIGTPLLARIAGLRPSDFEGSEVLSNRLAGLGHMNTVPDPPNLSAPHVQSVEDCGGCDEVVMRSLLR